MSAAQSLLLYHEGNMVFPIPKHSRSAVDRAGVLLAHRHPAPPPGTKLYEALNRDMDAYEKVNNWRSSHSYPMNTFNGTLRNKARLVCSKPLIAQRLKRYTSIIAKLRRQKTLRLSQMQDIGGLRAVVDSVKQVHELRDIYIKMGTEFEHEFAAQSDYIAEPRDTGYRGVHLVYRYKNWRAPEEYTGLQIELQFRTRLQHVWATAVETVDAFLGESLKSSEGSDEWQEFFALTGSAFAHIENCPPILRHRASSKRDLFDTILEDADKLKVREQLAGYRVAVNVASDHMSHAGHDASAYHLIVLNLDTRRLAVTPFSRERLTEATDRYMEIEKEINEGRQSQAVLVSAGKISALKRAYPNYFGDTEEFIKMLDSMAQK